MYTCNVDGDVLLKSWTDKIVMFFFFGQKRYEIVILLMESYNVFEFYYTWWMSSQKLVQVYKNSLSSDLFDMS